MFPFWNSGVGFWPVFGSGKPVAEIKDFSRSAVSFRPGILQNFRILELTSGGWNSWILKIQGIFGHSLVSFRGLFSQAVLKLTRGG